MSRPDDPSFRGWRFESFEERLALSVQPVADVWHELAADQIVEPSSSVVQPLGSAEGHGWNDLAAARQQYGLAGSGQTVAIIDSGIAYDHVALGGGLGGSYRVVGGWDFAENDANPYDDGPAGFHGTHVAGIVGAEDSRYPGVAPGVDLVALRVFDDQGNSNLNWVDQALKWVHQHRGDYESPITTINLSLGAEWNSTTLPRWANLESDLKQLADDGLFISVAAGNSFLTYNQPGLAYPAVSPNVTPVASTDSAGNLSRYSQRDSRVLAAPGEKITSTLPDAFYGSDGIKNDWGAASGTSMAAPYVAGASVLVREAMQDLGYTSITQASIDDLFHRTADKVYDPATQASFDRINVGRALGTLVGPDDFGASSSAAASIGQLSTSLQVGGIIGSTTDQDYFQFTAARSGKATLTLTDPPQLDAHWQPAAGGQIAGSKLTLDVVAGQSYAVGIAGGGTSIGKYAVDLQLGGGGGGAPAPAPSPPPKTPPAAGFSVTISGNSATVVGTSGSDSIRWDGPAQRLTIDGASYSLAGVSQITIDGSGGSDSLTLVGTSSAETIVMRPGSADLTASGYHVSATGVETIQFTGGAGDKATLYDSPGSDTFTATPTQARMQARSASEGPGSEYANSVIGVSSVVAISQGGGDTARLYDSAGNDTLVANPRTAILRGSGFSNEARGFTQVIASATAGGYDTATLSDSTGYDQLDASASYAWLRGSGYSIRAESFDNLTINATAGRDFAHLIGSNSNDVLGVWRGNRNFYSAGTEIHISNFQKVQFDGAGGYDSVNYYSGSNSGYLYGRSNYGSLIDQVFETQFNGVESVLAQIRQSHRLKTDLAALEFIFQKFGRK